MIATKPEVQLDGLYSASQAARALGISTKSVCRYRNQGILRGKIRRASGRWVCTGAEVLKVWREVF